MKEQSQDVTIDDTSAGGEACPECGLEKRYWWKNCGMGFIKDEMRYCCEGCAEEGVCVCQFEPETEGVSRIEKELGDRIKRSQR